MLRVLHRVSCSVGGVLATCNSGLERLHSCGRVHTGLVGCVDGGSDGVGHLLAISCLSLVDDDEVDVLERALDRIALDVARLDEHRSAIDVHREHDARLAQRKIKVAGGDCDVNHVGATAVDDGRDLALAADAAGGALAEIGAGNGRQCDGAHGVSSVVSASSAGRPRRSRCWSRSPSPSPRTSEDYPGARPQRKSAEVKWKATQLASARTTCSRCCRRRTCW